jgi:hypothetical protein
MSALGAVPDIDCPLERDLKSSLELLKQTDTVCLFQKLIN